VPWLLPPGGILPAPPSSELQGRVGHRISPWAGSVSFAQNTKRKSLPCPLQPLSQHLPAPMPASCCFPAPRGDAGTGRRQRGLQGGGAPRVPGPRGELSWGTWWDAGRGVCIFPAAVCSEGLVSAHLGHPQAPACCGIAPGGRRGWRNGGRISLLSLKAAEHHQKNKLIQFPATQPS